MRARPVAGRACAPFLQLTEGNPRFFPFLRLIQERQLMNDRGRKRLRRGERVRDLATSLKAAFPEGSKAAASIAKIIQLIERIKAHDISSVTNAREIANVSGAKGDARKELRDILRVIARTARTVGMDDPELKGKFRMPKGSLSDQALLSTARSFVAEATPLKERFVAYGLSADFVNTYGQKIAAFEERSVRHNTSRSARASDNAGVAAALDELDAEVERLDTIMRNTFADDHETLAAWDLARRLERLPQRHKARNAGNGGTPQTGK